MRNWLAEVDELVVKKQASWGVSHIIFDNLDININQLHHLPLPVLMFELYPTFHLPNNDEKSFQETLSLFCRDTLDMDSVTNQSDKMHFLLVVKTVLANEICSRVEGLEWISGFFDKHHPHKNSGTASGRSAIHVDPPLALDEKKIQDMTQILSTFSNRYLNLLAENIPEDSKPKFLDCKKKVVECSCSEEELREAEAYLLDTAKEFGFLILHGDLLRLNVKQFVIDWVFKILLKPLCE